MKNMRERRGIDERDNTGQVMYEDFQPIADWTSDSNSHVLHVHLPGIKKEELKVEVDNNGRLAISGERQLSENKYKRSKQIYSLPIDSDIDKISGKFDGGILFVIIPKKENVIKEEPEEELPIADGIAEEQKQDTSRTEEKPEGGPKQETTTTTEEKPNKDGKDNDVIHDHGNGVHEEGNREEGADNKWKCGLHEDFHPIADWTHDSSSHVLLVELPGFKKENLKVEVNNNGRLAISGERQLTQNKYKRFKQIYSLPIDSDIDKISSKFGVGILFVIIPKKENVIKEEPEEELPIADGIAEEQKQDTSRTEEKPEGGPRQETTTTTEEKPNKDGKDNDDHGNGVHEEGNREEGAENKRKCGLREDFHPIADWTNNVLLVELPGFKKEELKVEVDNNGRLAVSGERQLSENKYKRFKEIYSLPTDSDIDKISGKLDGGVLFVIIPKKENVIEEEPKEQHPIADEIAEEQKQGTSKTEEKPEGTPKQETTTTTEEKRKKDGKDNDVKHDHENGIHEEMKRVESMKNKWKCGLYKSVREKEEKRSKFGFAKRAIERIARIKGVVLAAILRLAVGFGSRGTSEERDREKIGERVR
ncbi:protein RESTRICTED TEV MOVEMENT 2-like [Macadamia integrifolia]|uniref:protein RESTRICTED TEV MOVEMENT 2-like n=1 Tax=Macadamia integrifolia TaxID=60698 RepID=UPI001C4FBBCC|nr:protein RESTRICTED TEV MOVEMENT 2-like [Macadamia integrifolia]